MTYETTTMTAIAQPIPARMSGLNRAEICDVNFSEFVRDWNGRVDAKPAPGEAILDGSALDARGFRELFESQLISRHLDLMARVLRVQNKVFYTIGSSGHEGNAMVARLTRHTDPAFLHYRCGGFMAERFRKLPGMDPIMDSALSFAASKDDPASRRPPQGLGQQAVVGAAADLDDRLAPAQGLRHRGRDRAGAAHRPRVADPRRQHRDLLVRRRLEPTTPPRRPRSTRRRGPRTRSCRRRCCSCARTTASASR